MSVAAVVFPGRGTFLVGGEYFAASARVWVTIQANTADVLGDLQGMRIALSERMRATPSTASGSNLPNANHLTTRIRAEYNEMPGLSVTLAQAARLWNLDRHQCLHVLESLLNEGFLYRSRDTYLRVG